MAVKTYQLGATTDDRSARKAYPSQQLLWQATTADDRIAGPGPNPEDRYDLFLRHQLDIPIGSTINEAKVRCRAAADASGLSAMLARLIAEDDCAPFDEAEGTQIYREVALERIVDTSTVWVANSEYDIDAEITDLVQAFIDRTGYQKNNHIGLWLAGIGPTSTNVGHSSGGISEGPHCGDYIRGIKVSFNESGCVTWISAVLYSLAHEVKVKAALYKASDGSLLGQTQEHTITPNFDYIDFELDSPVQVENGTDYILAVWSDNGYCRVCYCGTSSELRYQQEQAYGSWPDPASFSTEGDKNLFIYCTFFTGNYCKRQASDYEDGVAVAPRLIVNYTPPTITIPHAASYAVKAAAMEGSEDDRGANLTADTWEAIDATSADFGVDADVEQGLFLRFAVSKPAAAPITSAYLRLTAALAQSDEVSLRIYLADYDNCAAFTDGNFATPSACSLTGTYVSWSPPAWIQGTQYSVDIADLAQAFVNRAGYSPGNYMGLCIKRVAS